MSVDCADPLSKVVWLKCALEDFSNRQAGCDRGDVVSPDGVLEIQSIYGRVLPIAAHTRRQLPSKCPRPRVWMAELRPPTPTAGCQWRKCLLRRRTAWCQERFGSWEEPCAIPQELPQAHAAPNATRGICAVQLQTQYDG